MNALTRWDLCREIDELRKLSSTLFGQTPVETNGAQQEALTVAEWAPVVDIVEDDNQYVLTAELSGLISGLKKEDIKVGVQNDVLTISGARRYETAEKDKQFHRVERAYGSFSIKLAIPENSAGEKVSVDFKDGVLQARLPKTEAVKPKQIGVAVG